jgi:hypothetical protein
MTKQRTCATICAILCAAAAPAAIAYDGLEADYATCTQGDGNTQAQAMVGACSRLIENSSKENELVGMFYALRASVNTDKSANCHDARKAMSLINSPGLRESAQELKKINC